MLGTEYTPILQWFVDIIWGRQFSTLIYSYPFLGATFIAFACIIVCMTISFVFKFILELIK